MAPNALIVWRAAAITLGFVTVIAVFHIFATNWPLEHSGTMVLCLGLAFAASAGGFGAYCVGYPSTSKAITVVVWRAAVTALRSATVIAVFYIFATPILPDDYRSPLVLSLGLTFAVGAAGYSTYRASSRFTSEGIRILSMVASGIIVFALVLYLTMYVILNSVPT
jgi:hypothetical protein